MANRMALQKAITALMGDIGQSEANELRSMGKPAPLVKVEVEAGNEGDAEGMKCPECEAGTCMDPEHMSPEDEQGMAEMYGT